MAQPEGIKFLEEIENLLNKQMGFPAGTLALKAILQTHGGVEVYIPTATERYVALRNEHIRAKFKGDNHDDLAAEYGLCTLQVRRILKTAKKKP